MKSPRIAALEQSLEAAKPEALADFWQQVEAQGAPLVEPIDVEPIEGELGDRATSEGEPIEGEPDHCLVTFLWRDRGGTKQVMVTGAQSHANLEQYMMRHLANTDLWYVTFRRPSDWRVTYSLAPDDAVSPTELTAESTNEERLAGLLQNTIADPLNPRTMAVTTSWAPSLLELPNAAPQSWWHKRDGIACGEITEHKFRSQILGNERSVWIYAPPGFVADAAQPADLLVIFDGDVWGPQGALPIGPMMDNLLAKGRIAPTVVVMPDSLDGAIRKLELGCYDPFVDFLTDELLAWVNESWPISQDPARSILAGQSLGGTAAAFVALRRPDRFGKVLSQSGAFFWKRGTDFDLMGEWLTRQYALTPKLPIQFYLEVGLLEDLLLRANRHFRNVLTARQYDHVKYVEYYGDHDYSHWRGSFADGLLALSPAELSTIR